MRRQSLRPRQIDVHARMRIIRSDEDLVLDDDGASGGGGSSGGANAGGAQPATTFEELIGSVEDTHHAAHKPKRKKNIPIPVNLTVAAYDEAVKDDFVAPSSYVRFQTVPLANEDEKVEIDLEFAEIKWLKQHPKYGDNGDPRYQISTETLARMLDALEKASTMINPNVITPAEAEEVFSRQLQMVKTPLNKVTVDVYNYWVQKRQALKRPLLRKYWPQTPLNDTNPHLVFRPREKERYKLRKHRKNDMEGYRKLQQLRADCERVLHLLDLVKRREKAKRLNIEFLDEIRRQAVHELTDRSGEVRKPDIPVDDERAKSRKKKKKKKHRRDGEGEDGVASGDGSGKANGTAADAGGDADSSRSSLVSTGTADGGVTGARSSAALSGSGDSKRVATFLEYDTSKNFSLQEDADPEQDLKAPYYPSYPAPPSHLMASVFMQPPKYRCRGRIGRGGRLVIDRIPVPSSRYYGPVEQSATVGKFAEQSRAGAVGAVGVASAGGATQAAALGEAINSSHHAAILIHETSFRPLMSKIESVTSKRLEEIYGMSDSEDEQLEPLTASVYDDASGARKQANGNGPGSSTTATTGSNKAISTRASKFALDL